MEDALLPKGIGSSEDETETECFLTTSYFKQARPQVPWFFFSSSLIGFVLLLSIFWLYLQDK